MTTAPTTILAYASEDGRFAALATAAREAAQAAHARLILYDIDAASVFTPPLPTRWSAEGTTEDVPSMLGPQELESAGRAGVARLVEDARSAGIEAYAWLPAKKGADALASYADEVHADLIMVPQELAEPSLIKRLQGETLKSAVDQAHRPVALVKDLTKFAPKELDKLLGSTPVDVIVGGPPCQGFSKARQVGGSNSGERLVYDPRRELYREFLKYVAYYQPSVFVMENVPGIRTAAGGAFFTAVQVDSRELGYRVIPYEVSAWRFGVPQKRIRQLIIGTRRELPLFIPDRYIRETHADPGDPVPKDKEAPVTLGEAIGDLPEILAGDERHIRRYDAELRRQQVRYVVMGTQSFFDRREVKDLLAYLKVLARPRDEASLLRILNTPARGISRATAERALKRSVSEGVSFWDAAKASAAAGEIPAKAAAAVAAFHAQLEQHRARFHAQPRQIDQLLRALLDDIGYSAEIERQRAETERQRAEIERQRADRLAAQLRALGIEPVNGPSQ